VVPTLLINGRFDTVQDVSLEPYFQHIHTVKWVTFENSSHTAMWEERER
jgi:pimeloyl-ACP methyl ester carboxylesterase